MEKVTIDEVANFPWAAETIRRLSEPLGAEHVVVNHYELENGDSFAFAYHSHEFQEEVFIILDGTATFETDAGEVHVGSGEAIRFEPGEFQRGWNHGDERVVALVLGAPRAYGNEQRLRMCDDCAGMRHHDLEVREENHVPGGRVIVAICADCHAVNGEWSEGSMPGEVP